MDDDVRKEINRLKELYGKGWKKLFKVKKTYPFGRKSNPRYMIVRR